MSEYIHKIQYYETDKMGITHHSNYIRWMEEARVDYLEKLGCGFDKIEEKGIVSPVIGVECKYLASTRFPEQILINVSVCEFKGVKLRMKYVMKNASGNVVCEAKSEHCFLDINGRPVRLDRVFPELYKELKKE